MENAQEAALESNKGQNNSCNNIVMNVGTDGSLVHVVEKADQKCCPKYIENKLFAL